MLFILLNWHVNTSNFNYLKENSGGSGPVAIQSKRYIDSVSGKKSELVLEEQIRNIPEKELFE